MIRATLHNIIAKPIPQKDRNGIITLDESNPHYLQVLSVGSKVEDIKEGDYILPFGELTHHTVNGQKVFIISSAQVKAIVDEEDL